MNKTSFFIFLFLSFASQINAQDLNSSETPILDGFTTLIENSNDYKGYKVVDYNDLITLKKNTLEFIAFLKNENTTQENSIDQQKDEISELKASLETTKQNLAAVTAEKDAITFLGIPFSKDSYMALMWGIVAVLILTLLFFIFRFNKRNIQTTEAKKNLLQTEKEFEDYRVKALEKEQRLGRLLQDERNRSSDK